MTIYRDGKAIELTRDECRKAYEELDREYKKEDIGCQLELMEIELDITDELVDDVDHALGNNDSYWDSYWRTVEYSIEEYMKEKR